MHKSVTFGVQSHNRAIICIVVITLIVSFSNRQFDNNVDSKRHIIIGTAILYNEINSGQL